MECPRPGPRAYSKDIVILSAAEWKVLRLLLGIHAIGRALQVSRFNVVPVFGQGRPRGTFKFDNTSSYVLINWLFPDCLNVKSMRSARCYKKLNSAGADSENNLGGSSETICTTSDLTFTRKRSATV